VPTARQERRSDAEIIADALSVIRPTAAHRDACRTELEGRIGLLRRHGREKPLSAAQYKEKLNDYRKALRTARNKFPYLPEPLSESDAEFDAHVRFQAQLENDIKYITKVLASVEVRRGSNPLDLCHRRRGLRQTDVARRWAAGDAHYRRALAQTRPTAVRGDHRPAQCRKTVDLHAAHASDIP